MIPTLVKSFVAALSGLTNVIMSGYFNLASPHYVHEQEHYGKGEWMQVLLCVFLAVPTYNRIFSSL